MLLLANAPRSTKDIDIFWLDEDGLQRAYAPLRESTQAIKQKHDLDATSCFISIPIWTISPGRHASEERR